jgi:hypothetical protein
MHRRQMRTAMPKPKRTTLLALLALMLAGLLALPVQLSAAATTSSVDSSANSARCKNTPPRAGGRDDPERSGRNKRCTPTPISTSKATPTHAPTNTPTTASTATPTATETATPTDTATATPTDTATATSTPMPVPPANITVYNTGAFFVQYYVSYNLPGLPLQSLYSGVFNVNQGVTLSIPGEATNVGVLIQVYTGITGWQTACTRSYAQATSAVIITSGTTFLVTCTGG